MTHFRDFNMTKRIVGEELEAVRFESRRVHNALKHHWDSVVLLYVDDSRPRAPRHAGCGVAVKLGANCYLLTAKHVLDNLDGGPVLLGCKAGMFNILEVASALPDGPANLDTAVIGLNGDAGEALWGSALGPDELDLGYSPDPTDLLVLYGFPHRTATRLKGRILNPEPSVWYAPPTNVSDYEKLGIDPRTHLAVNLDVMRCWSWEGDLHPGKGTRGASGSGLWRLDRHDRGHLVGIFIENRARQLVATRVLAHVALALADSDGLNGRVNRRQNRDILIASTLPIPGRRVSEQT